MKPITATLPKHKPTRGGWTNRLLRVDLSAGRVWAQETAPYAPAMAHSINIRSGTCQAYGSTGSATATIGLSGPGAPARWTRASHGL